jgi:protein SCO1
MVDRSGMMDVRLYQALAGIAMALVAGLVIGGCGLLSDDEVGPENGSDLVASADGPSGILLEEPVPAPDFELTDHTGTPYRLSNERGNAVAIFFGYTGCPDICPLTLSFMADAAEQLGDQMDDVTFLLITVDPEADDPERLELYISRIDAPLVALTGTSDELESVWADYDIMVERHDRDDGHYLIDHSAQIWLVDPSGDVVGFLPMGSDGDDLARDLRWLLNRSG